MTHFNGILHQQELSTKTNTGTDSQLLYTRYFNASFSTWVICFDFVNEVRKERHAGPNEYCKYSDLEIYNIEHCATDIS